MPGTVASMKELLEQKITESGGTMHNDVYVFQLWDNTLHAAWAEDTATIPHTKDSLGKYHVHGDAIIVPVSTQTEIFKTLLPLLRRASNHSSVLVGPLPRYLYVPCCRDQEHVTNLKNDDFRTKMRTECDNARQKIRDSAWISGLARTKAINPGRSLREFCVRAGIDERQVWGDDPVHPSREGYKAIAEEIVKVAATAGAPPANAKRAPDRSPHGDRKRGQWTRGRGGALWGHRGRPERGHSAGPSPRPPRGQKRGYRRPY
jgi:lysophospholipase L1-like esterase